MIPDLQTEELRPTEINLPKLTWEVAELGREPSVFTQEHSSFFFFLIEI